MTPNDANSDELEIREARPTEHDSAVALLAAQLDEHEIDLPLETLRQAVATGLEHPDRGSLLVATRNGALVGVAYLSYQWTLEYGGKVAWLEELYVVPSLRGQGIGQRLLRAAIDHVKARGCRAMDLEVEANHARAARLYEREGFHRHARTRYYLPLG